MVLEEVNWKDRPGYDKELMNWRGVKRMSGFFSSSRIRCRGLRDVEEGLTPVLRLLGKCPCTRTETAHTGNKAWMQAEDKANVLPGSKAV